MTAERESEEAPSEPRRNGVIFANLGSGSGGNSSVIAWRHCGETRAILVDLGFSPRRVRDALASLGVRPDQVVAACLTHLDHDHFAKTWANALRHRSIPLFVHRAHRADALASGAPEELLREYTDAFEPDEGVCAEGSLARHDESGSVALRFEIHGAAIGFATDLGRVPESLLERFAGIDLLAIESNHCPRLQQASPRPAFMKRRIMGGSGHLSNYQAIAAIAAIARRAPLQHVVLLHLSRQCNCPDLVRRLVAESLPGLLSRLSITRQDSVTGPLRIDRSRRTSALAEPPGLFEFV